MRNNNLIKKTKKNIGYDFHKSLANTYHLWVRRPDGKVELDNLVFLQYSKLILQKWPLAVRNGGLQNGREDEG